MASRYEAGREARKRTTFEDFICVARALIAQGWTCAGKILYILHLYLLHMHYGWTCAGKIAALGATHSNDTYTCAGKIAALGASAGGTTVCVAANEAPELFGAVVAQVEEIFVRLELSCF
jgi:protease II